MKIALILAVMLAALTPPRAAERTYLESATQAARWVRSAAVQTEHGLVWPADPNDAKSVNLSLYAGAPGVVLFLLEAYRATREKEYLADAQAGADHLLATLNAQKEAGLYTGLAGAGFTLIEVTKATGEGKYRQGAARCLKLLRDRAAKAGKGVQWNDSPDIISGGAGTGLFLLYAARELDDPAWRELAVRAGQRLVELGRAEGGGLKWAMDAKSPRLMPNFSHGTAGVAYFLATLYGETKQKEFLEAALAGAKYLQSVAKTEGDTSLIFHNEQDGKDLYYLGWCHGPAGTARLFYRLWRVTGDAAWLEWVHRSARTLLQSGIPDKQTPGFWNNVGQCCGSAGVAEFFYGLYRVTQKSEYLEFAKHITDHLLTRATPDDGGLKWVHAEHRAKPELVVAQTGYMQGAAGIGMWLLRWDSFLNGDRAGVTLPDSPF